MAAATSGCRVPDGRMPIAAILLPRVGRTVWLTVFAMALSCSWVVVWGGGRLTSGDEYSARRLT
jgi:peptidoglycan/LPS O-acetylase OafA/YrhL